MVMIIKTGTPLRHAIKCNYQGWYQKEMCLG